MNCRNFADTVWKWRNLAASLLLAGILFPCISNAENQPADIQSPVNSGSAAQVVDAQTENTTPPSAAVAELVWPSPPLQPRIRYLGSISSPEDLGRKKGFWRKVWEFMRGEEESEEMIRPMAVAVDSQDRLLVADSKRFRVHVYDRRKAEYAYLQGSETESMQLPIGLAVDGNDNIYVADGELSKIFVFDKESKFIRMLDTADWLTRPSALAIDRERKRLYVVDTPAHNVKVVDLTTGKVSNVIGRRGEDHGDFNFPTYVALGKNGQLAVTDSMNMRIQIFDHEGQLVSSFGKHGDGSGDFATPKGLALDSEGHIYVADAGFDNVQVFDENGKLLLFWGAAGQKAGEFWLPTGLHIDGQDRIYIADSYNSRIQIFQYLGEQNAK